MRERHLKMAGKQASESAPSHRVFGQARKPAKMFRAGLYAPVSTLTISGALPIQNRTVPC